MLNTRAACICLLLTLGGQDPATREPQSRPQSRAATRPPLPPIEESWRSAVDPRRDLIQRFTATAPLQGFWQLRGAAGPDPAVAAGLRGYLVIGDRHLSVHLLGPKEKSAAPFFQSGFRRYRIEGDRLITTGLIGVVNRPDGSIVIEDQPMEEVRVFERIGAVLRIRKVSGEYLDFVRIE